MRGEGEWNCMSVLVVILTAFKLKRIRNGSSWNSTALSFSGVLGMKGRRIWFWSWWWYENSDLKHAGSHIEHPHWNVTTQVVERAQVLPSGCYARFSLIIHISDSVFVAFTINQQPKSSEFMFELAQNRHPLHHMPSPLRD